MQLIRHEQQDRNLQHLVEEFAQGSIDPIRYHFIIDELIKLKKS
jgi:hypothetical protein